MSEPKTVVVTGTSRGLGLAIAARLLAEGFTVIGIARSTHRPAELLTDGGRYEHITFDLGETGEIGALAKRVVAEFGVPHGLVNNAAIGTDGVLPTMHNNDIERVMGVNLIAPIVLAKYFCRPMLDARSGRIVNISSIVANTGYRGLSAYAASKAGLEGFTRSLARDLGPRGVTVNCVAPGFLATEMTAALGSENLERIRRRAALSRFPTRDEIAGAVSYLVGPDGAGITGTTVTVDAGNTA